MKRSILVGMALACVPLAGAKAAPRQVCRLLGPSTPATVDAPNADLRIVSADIASDARNVTAAIRLQDLAEPAAPVSGQYFSFYFSRGDRGYVLAGTLWGTKADGFMVGATSERYDPASESTGGTITPLGSAKVVVDAARNEVRMTAPLSAFRDTGMRKGARLTYLAALTSRMYGTSQDVLPSAAPRAMGIAIGQRDTVGGSAVGYVLGNPSCVAVGR